MSCHEVPDQFRGGDRPAAGERYILAEVLRVLSERLEPGQTTGFLSDLAAKELVALGGRPAFLGYQTDPRVRPFPAVICISVNDEVVHGIPGPREIKVGDLVGLDFGVNYEGMIIDGAVTVVAGGAPSPAAERLLIATEEALATWRFSRFEPAAGLG